MAEIATFFFSPLLQVFYEKVVSGEFVGFFRQQKLSDGLLKKLKTTFLTLNAVFEDAEELQVSQKPAVKEWLDELKDAIYDAEDVLDEIATEALLSELDAEFQAPASKVRKLSSSSSRNSSIKEIELKIKEVLERLETLAQQIDLLGLKEGVGGKSSGRSTTSSLVVESDIFGRNDEKEAIIKMLLSDDARGKEMGVIAIVGMGGIGKTTLAQLVYNNDEVKKHFNLEAWVCVSDEFDVIKLTKIILEAVTSSPCSVTDLNQLQLKLKKCLMGKKFLVVLDDVWNENYVQWEDLSKPFKPEVDEWDKILRSELWDLSIDEIGNILPALKLSYKYLPSHLKQCFAYSSIFPKDYAFKKDQLIMLWMAEGFLQQPKNKTMEEVGNEYFLTLESRSLFQKSSDKKSCFIMHDLVSDLAKSISGNFIIRLEDDCSRGIVNNTRHMSYFFKENFHRLKMFKTLDRAKRLRTFLHCNMSGYVSYLTKKVVNDLLPTLRCLRVLSLSNYNNIAELPDLNIYVIWTFLSLMWKDCPILYVTCAICKH
jgi:hypothetical protein